MNLALVFHNHQPVGQLPWAFEDVADHCYEPFLAVLSKHPTISAALHYTGPLLEWLGSHRPALIARLQELSARGQIEILGGGYYEPILAVWPPTDQRAQIELLSARVSTLFGAEPAGLWLAERVWEPGLVSQLRRSNIDYTFVDSAVFEAAGISADQQFGFYEVGEGLRVFPINEQLRYLVPWRTPEETIAYLKSAHAEQGDNALVVFADDGEKFGAWPGTFEFIYGEGWLEKFFNLLEANAAWLHLVTPRQYARNHKPLGSIDLPSGSYAEMQGWSGGNWRNFLDRYEESHDMYAELIGLSEQRQTALATVSISQELLDKAGRHILSGQCNDAYWHGTFGGLYLRHLRQAIFADIAAARASLDPPGLSLQIGVGTAAQPGRDILVNELLAVDARPASGQIGMLMSKVAKHNLLSTLRRHREPYLPADAEVDWYPRGALIDHFFGPGTTPELFQGAGFAEQGDFASEPWQLVSTCSALAGVLSLHRKGGVWSGSEWLPLEITKRIGLSDRSGSLDVTYTFTNLSQSSHKLWWGCEWNVAVTGVALPDRHYHAVDHKVKLPLDEIASFNAVTNPIVADRWLQLWLEWQFEEPIGMWHVPIFTISQKEGGEIERTHQSSAFLFHRNLELRPTEPLVVRFKAVVTATPKANV